MTYDLDYMHERLVSMGFETSELRKSNWDMVYFRLTKNGCKIVFRDLFIQHYESYEKVVKAFKGVSKKKIQHYDKYTDLSNGTPEYYYTPINDEPYRGENGKTIVPYHFEAVA